ncbi:related to stress protein ORP150 [Cephalotrichum gorgonifer]|uniref:Related to stress protein ORP150 n=1 Tax=Cephalotrichum gorgonifer TaxID=2041049 RepID=A0AAE8MZB8_9PEZI|nr:related to stress protein ORP150 [Cephalotrichum gorgonifer]
MARVKILSPLALLLSAVFLFTAAVSAGPAALGVDLGTEYIKASLIKPGIPLEIVLTKDTRRKETTAVAFKPERGGPKAGVFPERYYGSDAMALAPRFPADVYPNLKHILGLPLDHSIVQEYASRYPGLQLEADPVRGSAALKSKAFAADEEAWMVEELLAMELQNIRKNAEALAGDGTAVRSLVLTIPPYFSAEEKRALRLAADLAGLKVLSLLNDGVAVGLHYATSRQFPNINEGADPEYHLVFDIGAGSASASVMRFRSRTVKDVGKFNKTIQEIHVLGNGWDRSLGGDALNSLIVDDMISQFLQTPAAQKVSVEEEKLRSNGRAVAKLYRDAEKVRHVLSANQNTQASIESLYDDVDFKYTITRDQFEAMAASHPGRIADVVNNALKAAGIDVSDLTSAILNGGTTRTPFVQKALADVLGSTDKIRTSVNSDEAAVLGAGFKAADLSPGFRVKDIKIYETANYAAGIKWASPSGKQQRQQVWTPTSHIGAAAKEVTLPNHEDLSVTFYQLVDGEERDINLLTTTNLTASVAELKEKYSCEDADIHFKLGLKLAAESEEVVVSTASVECLAEVKDSIMDGVKNLFGFGKKDQEPLGGEDSSSSSSTTDSATADPAATPAEAAAEAAAEKPAKKQTVTIPVAFTLEEAGTPALPKERLQKLKDRLKAFEKSDRARVLREEAVNQLEGYTYKVRDLLDAEDFVAASTEAERETLRALASETGDWLYDGGADAPRDELTKRLKALKALVEPVERRVAEAAERPEVVRELKSALDQTDTFVANLKKQIADYVEWHAASAAASPSTEAPAAESSESADFDGLEDDAAPAAEAPPVEEASEDRGPVPPVYELEDVSVVEELAAEARAWLAELEAQQEALSAQADPVLLVADVKARRAALDKAGMDLAMKGVKKFEAAEKKKKAAESSSAKSKSKTKTTKSQSKTEAEAEKETKAGTEGGHDEL